MACVMETLLRMGSQGLRRRRRSRLDDDVTILDKDWEGLGHIWALLQLFATLDGNRKGADFYALRIEPGLPVAHVEFPAVPAAAQEFADAGSLIDAGFRRGQPRHARGLVERRARVRTAVEQRKEFAIDVEDHDIAAFDANHLVAAGRDIRGARDDVTSHLALLAIKACRAHARCR